MPFGTSVTALVATYTTTGANVAVGATPQISGTTANDFTSSVSYTVTAADGTAVDYTVTVTITPATYTLSGQFQKGPFAIGSSIAVNEQDNNLNPTGDVYNVQTSDDLGSFSVASKIKNHLVEIVGDGFYMDELTGNLAASRVQIRAIADLKMDNTPTVNILTSLQAQRLKKLITNGSTYAAAYTQSQNEVLAAFGIDSNKVSGLTALYSMQIDGNTDADSVLLAVSSILSKMAANAAAANGTAAPAELSNYITQQSVNIATPCPYVMQLPWAIL